MPSTIVMFLLSKRMGRLADRFGPRLFMGLGPLTAAVGLALMLRLDAHVNYFTDLLPALLVFSLGLASTVAPLTAAVLSDADESDAGIASGVNNAIARVAGLLAIAAVGARHLRAVQLDARSAPRRRQAVAGGSGRRSRTPAEQTLARVDPARAGVQVAHAVQSASVDAFHVGIGISAIAGRARRSARARRDPQPTARRALRGLRRRPARRPAARRRARPDAEPGACAGDDRLSRLTRTAWPGTGRRRRPWAPRLRAERAPGATPRGLPG